MGSKEQGMIRTKALVSLLFAAVLACGGCPVGAPLVEGPPRARISTSLGEFLIELDPNDAPLTVENFLQYVDEGFYDGTIFHRVIPNFVVQGGGYLPGLEPKPTHAPIVSEAANGLLNLRGTVGMARGDDVNSATSQFYVNLVDNPTLDTSATSLGYTVFGRVIDGMAVIDQIAAVPTETRGDSSDVPVEDVLLLSARQEPGAPTLAPDWEVYFEGVQYNLLSGLREVVVQALEQVIMG
jgi:peptidyl-prolyl cis-trans isomerase A (cyclophilin A)